MISVRHFWPNWEIEKEIGKGSYGHVYLAKRQDKIKTFYSAIKLMCIPQDEDAISELRQTGLEGDALADFYTKQLDEILGEIVIMESLKSSGNIVSIEDYHYEPQSNGVGWVVYIRMELLTSLKQKLEQLEHLDEREVVKIGIHICDALLCCKQKHIIHRDIKPDNILVDEFGNYKLGDFGIARQMEGNADAKTLAGTKNYMAPEIIRMEKYDGRVDIYSLGIVLYRLLNEGRLPFIPKLPTPEDIENARVARLRGDPLPPPATGSDLTISTILKACSYDMNQRFNSADEFKTALLACQKYMEDHDSKIIRLTKDEDHIKVTRDDQSESIFRNYSPNVFKECKIDYQLAMNGGTLLYKYKGKSYKIRIPAGIKDGVSIKIPGYSQNGTNGGDLFLKIHIDNDSYLKSMKMHIPEETTTNKLERQVFKLCALYLPKMTDGLNHQGDIFYKKTGIPEQVISKLQDTIPSLKTEDIIVYYNTSEYAADSILGCGFIFTTQSFYYTYSSVCCINYQDIQSIVPLPNYEHESVRIYMKDGRSIDLLNTFCKFNIFTRLLRYLSEL